MTAITALTACKKVNRISTEIFVCWIRVFWILTSIQSQCPSILSISIMLEHFPYFVRLIFERRFNGHNIPSLGF